MYSCKTHDVFTSMQFSKVQNYAFTFWTSFLLQMEYLEGPFPCQAGLQVWYEHQGYLKVVVKIGKYLANFLFFGIFGFI